MLEVVQKEITIKGSTDTRSYTVPFTARLKVEEGQIIDRGAPLTEGSIDPKNYYVFVTYYQLKTTYYVKYKKYTVCKA